MVKRTPEDDEDEAFERGRPANTSEEHGSAQPGEEGARPAKKRPRKKAAADADAEEEAVELLPQEIRHVNRLRLTDLEEGTLVLGAVREVNEEELTLNLPYNLLGYCQRSQAVEASVASEVSRTSLHELYKPGKLVVAVITAIVELNGKKQRIEVSLRPALANAGLTVESLQQHMWLPACVSGDEEHVLKLDFGVENLCGLLKKKELGDAAVPERGSILMVAVQAVNATSSTVRCCIASSEPLSSQPIEQKLLKAGLLVSARIKKVLSGDEAKVGAGLVAHFNGALSGVVHLHHQASAAASDAAADFKKNQRVSARVLAVIPGSPPIVHLTLLPHLLEWTSQGDALPLAANIGDRLEAEIVDFKHKFGCRLRCEREQEGKKSKSLLPGFCAQPRLADPETEPSAASLAIGFKTGYRVLAYNFLDGLVMLTRRPADLEEGVLVSVTELSAGQLVSGTVTRTADHGVFVKLSDYVAGHVHLRQLTDVPLASVSKRFQVGAKVKCRVMHVDAGRRQISLTAKKSLVRDEFQLTANVQAKPNMLVTGYVSGIHDYGAIVSFYGGAFGLIPAKDMAAEEAPALGMAVRCRVAYVDKQRGRLILSLNLEKGQAATEIAEKAKEKGVEKKPGVPVGTVVSEVHAIRCGKDGLLVRFEDSEGKRLLGYVSISHLSDDLTVAKSRHAALASELGGIVSLANAVDTDGSDDAAVSMPDQGVVLAKNYTLEEGSASGLALLSLKASMRLAAESETFVRNTSELKIGRLYAGYIKEVKDFGALVCVGSWRLAGVAHKHQVAAKFVEKPSEALSPGQSVRVLVAGVDVEKNRFDADLRPCAVAPSDAPLLTREAEALRISFSQQEALSRASSSKKSAKRRLSLLSPGSMLDAEVKSVETYGLVLSAPARDGLTAVALKENMPENFKAQEGAQVKCAVLDFDPESGIADVSLQPELLGASSPSSVASSGKKRKEKGGAAASAEARPAAASGLKEGQEVAVLPALEKKGYTVLWCQDPPAVLFAPPFGARKWKEARTTTVHSVQAGSGEAARVVVCCPAGGKDKKAGKVPRILRPEEELQVGSPVKMRIRSVRGLQVFCTAPVGLRGHLHATQFLDLSAVGSGGESPLEGMRKTGVIEARMLHMQQRAAGPEDTEVRGDKVWHLELSCRPSLMEPKDTSDYEASLVRWSNLKPGRTIAAAVLSVQKSTLWMEVAPGLKGRVALLDASSDASVLRTLHEHFHTGQVFQARVLRAVSSRKELDLSLIPAEGAKSKGRSYCKRLAKLQKLDDNAGGKGMVATFRLPERRRATAHITELFDVWAKQPTRRLKVGSIYEVAVLRDWDEDAPAGLEGRAEVSLRPSLVHGQKEAEEEKRPLSASSLAVGQKVTGYVVNAGPHGIFVALSRSLVARVKLKSISEKPVMKEAVAKLHPPGSLIRDATVVEIDSDKNRVELSLRSGEGPGRITVEQLSVGDVVSGRVKAVEHYGLFVRLDNSSVDAMIHKSEVSDSASISLDSYQVGAKITKAKVLKIDGHRVSLTIKPSNFEPDELDNEEDDEDSDDIQDLIASVKKDTAKRKRSEAEAAEEEAEDAEELDVEEQEAEEPKAKSKAAKKKQKKAKVVAPEVEAKPEPDSDEEPWRQSSGDGGRSAAFEFAEFKVNAASSSDEDAGESDDGEDVKRLSKRQKKAKKLAEQKELQQQEAENADGQWADDPRSVEDFERLLLTQGDTSIVWIRYMAFHLKMSDLEKARQVAERAVKHVGFSESKERFNAWVAYMNLECTFGTDETADAVFRRAASHNDAKEVYLQLARIHERNKKPQLATKAYEACSRKFPHSKQVWIAFLTFLYQQEDFEGARKMLPKSLAALPRVKHPLVVSKAALLEYQHGSPERGRSIFEGLLDSYPKRTDLWSVYLDAHIKAHTPPKVSEADSQEVRALMERCCAMKLKATKMRFFFKRWLDFEKKWGDAESQERVRGKAREFVEGQAS